MRPTSTSPWPEASIGSGYLFAAGSSTTIAPGAFARTSRTISGVTFCENSRLSDSECARSDGTRTDVQEMRSDGSCSILRDSFTIFISSFV